MRLEQTEKALNRIDHDIDALRTSKKYLNNLEEIEGCIIRLNKERQGLIDELCKGDWDSYQEAKQDIEPCIGKKLSKEEQLELLSKIKEAFGRKAPVPGKNSHGLNAWLKELNVEAEWEEVPGQEWAVLTIQSLGVYGKNPSILYAQSQGDWM